MFNNFVDDDSNFPVSKLGHRREGLNNNEPNISESDIGNKEADSNDSRSETSQIIISDEEKASEEDGDEDRNENGNENDDQSNNEKEYNNL